MLKDLISLIVLVSAVAKAVADPLPRQDPSSAGFSKERLDRIGTYMEGAS